MSAAVLPSRTAAALASARTRPGRLDVLDGVRGWCALSVVFFHVFWEIFGVLAPGFRNPVTGFLFDGQLAVCVFFVLSGDALSAAFFAGKGDAATVRLAIKRYARLATPILAASLVVFALVRLDWVFSQDAAPIVGRAVWMGAWLQVPPTFADALQYSLLDVFTGANPDRAINPMLWTMRVELPGSFIVFALLLIWKWFSRPRALLLGLFAVSMAAPTGSTANFLTCFFAGVAFADWRARGVFAALERRFVWLSLAGIGAIGAADGFMHVYSWRAGKPAFAIVLVLAVYISPPLVAFFSGRLSRGLGRISFPLYLIQFPVLLSATSWLIVRAGAAGPPSLFAIWGISLASVAACLLAAIAFSPIESLTRRLCDGLVVLASAAFPALSKSRTPAAALEIAAPTTADGGGERRRFPISHPPLAG